ncbi:hypothetical protein [Pseudarthrobacter sp. WHRI 8279]|uniref:hypothetical protein n=1 Tax=Pseudarthrobacter sp. WHRI 8279 TaxID=3162566 RepID=UPI0032FB3250
MRQDYIQDMNDPRQRRQYAEADADPTNRWWSKRTRCFEHSADVARAWENLALAINDGQLDSDPFITNIAISDHINKTIPALTDQYGSHCIVVNPREVEFGPDWSADDIANMVARDFLPDAELIAALDAARTDQNTLGAITTAAKARAEKERIADELAAVDSYDGPYADDELWEPEADYPAEPAPRVELATYHQATASRPSHIYIELRVDRDLNPVNLARQQAAEERLSGGTDQVCASIDNVATRHLQVTGTSARIVQDGHAVNIEVNLPADPEDNSHRTAPDTDRDAGPPLTSDQKSILPELTRSIEAALPPLERHHTQTLAMMVAAEIPPTADVIRSSDRVTLAEVIEHHEQRIGSDQAPLPASIRLAELSFPQHPSAALHSSAGDTSPGPGGAPHAYLSAPDLER